jgi:hypothetical protein
VDDDDVLLDEGEETFSQHLLPVGGETTAIYLAETGRFVVKPSPDWSAIGELRMFRPSNPAIVARRRALTEELENALVDPATLTLNFARERERVGFYEMNQFCLDLCHKAAGPEGIPLGGTMWKLVQDSQFRPVEMMGYWINMQMHALRLQSSVGRSRSIPPRQKSKYCRTLLGTSPGPLVRP